MSATMQTTIESEINAGLAKAAARLMDQAAYEKRERELHLAHISRVESAPLADRKAGNADYLELLSDPARLQERAEWLLEGCYGKGAHMAAQAIRNQSKRANRAAAFGQLLAALECGCPADYARRAWLVLPTDLRAKVDEILLRALDAPEEE